MKRRYETSGEASECPRESIIEKMRFYEQHARFNATRRAFGEAAAELERLTADIARMGEAIRRHDRFYREELRYSGPDDPALDPACAEDWLQLVAALQETDYCGIVVVDDD